ncbi:MAG: hypothetical protein BWY11_01061 [Firmicutes bacterium ADurb.Bin182]|nr:MAG: hypothetical protein BWY11_01061 [Firmicutes bacterium ADurb.Bin182]
MSCRRILALVLIFSFIFVMARPLALADDTGLLSAQSYIRFSNPELVSDPENAYSSDGQYARFYIEDSIVEYTFTEHSAPIVPEDCRIDGIEVHLRVRCNENGNENEYRSLEVSLRDSNHAPVGNFTYFKDTGAVSSTSWSTIILGGPTEKWGYDMWTPGLVNDPLRVWLKCTGGSKDIWLDHLQLRVYYSPKYTINFVTEDPNKGTLSGTAEFRVTSGTEWRNAGITVPETNRKPGYLFDRWDPALPGDTGIINQDKTYTARWKENPEERFTVTLQAGEHGSLLGTKIFSNIITGTPWNTAIKPMPSIHPSDGYEFDKWDPELPDTITETKTYTALFKELKHIPINYEATAGGSINPSSEWLNPKIGVAQGSTATANIGYSFVNWTCDGVEVSTDAKFVPTKPGVVWVPVTYTANFRENADVTITYEAGVGGSVDRSSESLAPVTGIAQGSTATANDGYRFVNWTHNGVEVGQDAKFVPPKPEGGPWIPLTFRANFEKTYTATFESGNNSMGTVDLTSSVLHSGVSSVSSTAIPNAGYRFIEWRNGENPVSNNAVLTVFQPAGGWSDVTYTAYFEPVPYTIAFNSGDSSMGTVSPASASVDLNTVSVSSTATPNTGYRFVEWRDSNGFVSSNAVLTVPKPAGGWSNAAYTAYFEPVPHTITFNSGDSAMGTVSPASASVDLNTVSVSSAATPNTGYRFVEWRDSNDFVSSNAVLTVSKPAGGWSDAAYTAYFEKDPAMWHKVLFETDGGNGHLNGKTQYEILNGTKWKDAGITVPTPVPDNGYAANWSPELPDSNSESMITASITYKVSFIKDPGQWHTVTFEAGDHGYFAAGTKTEFTDILTGTAWEDAIDTEPEPVANAGYEFDKWDPVLPETITETETYTATFREKPDVTITYTAGAGGSVDPSSESLAPATGIAQGSKATADVGYSFVNWTCDGVEVSTDAKFVPTKPGAVWMPVTYIANFIENANVTITYTAGVGGSIDRSSESLAPATGIAQGSTATASDGYRFVNWTCDGVEVSTDANFVPTKPGAVWVPVTYAANFEKTYTVTFRADNDSMGTVDLTSAVLHSGVSSVSSKAIPKPGYRFVEWRKGTDTVTSEETLTVNRPDEGWSENLAYTAYFTELDKVTISYISADNEMGSVSRNSEELNPETGKAQGSEAEAMPGYEFDYWTRDDDSMHITENPIIPGQKDGKYETAVYTAYFKIKESDWHTVTFIAGEHGSFTGGETQVQFSGILTGSAWDESVTTPTPIADEDYKFSGWSAEFPEKIEGDLTYTAIFTELGTFTVTADAVLEDDSEGGGKITFDPQGGTYQEETSVTLTAVPGRGYTFLHWLVPGNTGSSDVPVNENDPDALLNGAAYAALSEDSSWVFYSEVNPITVMVDSNMSFKAVFKKSEQSEPTVNRYTVSYHTNGGTGAVPVDMNRYYTGDSITLASGAGLSKPGFIFLGWELRDGTRVESPLIMGNSDIILFAAWGPATLPPPKTGSGESAAGWAAIFTGFALTVFVIVKKRKKPDNIINIKTCALPDCR